MNRATAPLLLGILLFGSLQSIRLPAASSGPAVVRLSNSPPRGTQTAALSHGMLPRNEDGPWTALCRYFAAYDSEYFASQRRPTANTHREPGVRQATALEDTFQVTVDEHGRRWKKAVKERVYGDLASCVPNTFHAQVAYLLATVPDPINTHLALEYDRALESIERAAAASGFNFDRYWVPWDDLYAEQQHDLGKDRELKQDRHLREEEPGLFVFRRSMSDGTTPPLLLVFLVNETPTYGINKIAFFKSLSYIQKLNAKIEDSHRPLPILHIAGPTFSGSLDSLTLELETIAHDHRRLFPERVTIVSGSVSSSQAISQFQKVWERLRPQHVIDFQEVTFPGSRSLLDEILTEVGKVVDDPDAKQIAFLSESTSAYGNTVGEEAQPVANEHKREQQQETFSKVNEVTKLTFPIGIAALRNAYQTAQENADNAGKKREQQLPQITLPMNYRTNEIPEQENLPVAATTQTPLSQDAVLQQITRTLQEHDIKAVMIFASDSLDSLFLLHYLRETCPNIRVVLPMADLLYLRSNDAHDFTGTLIFTRYPLFSLGTPTKSSSIDPASLQNKFPSSVAEGQFFAVLSLLQPNIKYLTAKTDSTRAVPDFWMGVIGKSGYWPIRRARKVDKPPFFRTCEDADCTNLTSALNISGSVANRRTSEIMAISYIPGRPTQLWYLMAMVVTTGVFLHSFAVLTARYNWFKQGDRWWLEYFALDHGGGRYVQARAFFLFVATIQAAIAQVVILVPTLSLNLHFRARLWESGRELWPLLAAATLLLGFGLALVVAFLNAIWVFRNYHRAPSLSTFGIKTELGLHNANEKHIQLILRIATIVSVILSIAVVGTWGFLCLVSDDSLPFSDRAAAVTSGVCPSLPILLIAVGLYSWAIGSLRRITYFQNRAAHFPVSHFDDIMKSDFEVLRGDLEKTLGPVSLSTSGTVWFIVSAMFCLFLYRWVGLHSLEEAAFNHVIFAGVWLLWATLLFSIIRLMNIWAVLKKVLRRLERLPIRYAFSRIPRTFSWSPVWRRGGLRRSYLVQARSLEYLSCLSAESVPAAQSEVQAYSAAAASGGMPSRPSLVRTVTANPVPDIIDEVFTQGRLVQVRSALTEVVSRETQDHRITHNEANKLDVALLNTAEEMMEPLSRLWAKGGADGESEKILEPRQDLPSSVGLRPEQRQMLAAEFVALRFVAVFRYVSLQMRNLISMISLGFILALLALRSYPFQPRERIGWWLVTAFICLGGALTYVFMEMDRDATLSRISKTEANKLDREFFWPLLRFGALPLLTIIAAQFPAVSSFLFSWLQPALDSLH
jgi:hypothetical protein